MTNFIATKSETNTQIYNSHAEMCKEKDFITFHEQASLLVQ